MLVCKLEVYEKRMLRTVAGPAKSGAGNLSALASRIRLSNS